MVIASRRTLPPGPPQRTISSWWLVAVPALLGGFFHLLGLSFFTVIFGAFALVFAVGSIAGLFEQRRQRRLAAARAGESISTFAPSMRSCSLFSLFRCAPATALRKTCASILRVWTWTLLRRWPSALAARSSTLSTIPITFAFIPSPISFTSSVHSRPAPHQRPNPALQRTGSGVLPLSIAMSVLARACR